LHKADGGAFVPVEDSAKRAAWDKEGKILAGMTL
jgi:hypothetical protein